MMELHKKISVVALFASAMCLPLSVAAEENSLEISANMGLLSDYIFRGVHQSDASANGGIDLGYGPLYAGVWAADLDNDNGLEYDVYAGVDFAIGENYHAGIGYSIYRYTDDSDKLEVVRCGYMNILMIRSDDELLFGGSSRL